MFLAVWSLGSFILGVLLALLAALGFVYLYYRPQVNAKVQGLQDMVQRLMKDAKS